MSSEIPRFLERLDARNHFIARFLFQAVGSAGDQLREIDLICQAARLLPPSEFIKVKGEINDGVSDFDILSAVTVSLLHATEKERPGGKVYYIPWVFPLDDVRYDHYARQTWFKLLPDDPPILPSVSPIEGAAWEQLRKLSNSMPAETFNAVKALFLKWAVPKALEIFRLLVEELHGGKELPEGSEF